MESLWKLAVLVIFLLYVEVTTGTSCIGDREACSSIGSYRCNAGYRIHIFCNPGSHNSESCPHTWQCIECKTTNGSGTCNCIPVSYEYQGFCYFKHEHNATCYNVDSCRDINSVCSNSSGGICVCRPGYYYLDHYGKCVQLQQVGSGCYANNQCRDEHARCIGAPQICRCMDGYYEHQGSCILKHELNATCFNVDSCRDINSVCSNSSGGICLCRPGYYYFHTYGRCVQLQQVGSGCYADNQCRDEHARCIGAPQICRCMDGYYEHQGSCILKHELNATCYNVDSCKDINSVCSNSSGGICVCRPGYYVHHYGRCVQLPDSPQNLLVFNVTARSFTIGFEKPNEVFGELLGYVLKIMLADTGRCVIEYIIRCTSGCIASFPNLTDLPTTCLRKIQYKIVSKQDLVMMKHNENTLDPGTIYWVSVAAVGQYGKGFISDLNVTTLYQDVINEGSHSESTSVTTIIIASIACGTIIVIALTAAGTVIIIKRKRASNRKGASKRKRDAAEGSLYMDVSHRTNENQYDTIAVTSTY